jgi:hypothetical protein
MNTTIEEAVKELADEGRRTARRAVTLGRHAAEDLRDKTMLEVRRNPFRAVGWTFAAGALVGCTAGWLLARGCSRTR